MSEPVLPNTTLSFPDGKSRQRSFKQNVLCASSDSSVSQVLVAFLNEIVSPGNLSSPRSCKPRNSSTHQALTVASDNSVSKSRKIDSVCCMPSKIEMAVKTVDVVTLWLIMTYVSKDITLMQIGLNNQMATMVRLNQNTAHWYESSV